MEQRPEHAGPGPVQHEQPVPDGHFLALLVDQVGRHPGQREGGRAWLGGGQARQGGDHDGAGLGLPPGVDHRAPFAADDRVVPQPGLGVDGLTDRAEQPQRGQVVTAGVLLAPLHGAADRGGRRVEDRDPVLLDHVPPGVLVRVVGRALEHHRGDTVRHGAIDDVGVAGDPPDVGGAPEHILFRLEIEDHRGGGCHSGQVATRGVHDALGLGGGTGRVKQEQRMLGLHRLGRALRLGLGEQLVVPVVAALPHRAGCPGGPDDDHRLQGVQVRDGVIDGLLDRGRLAAPPRAVGGDEGLGLRHPHAVLDGGRREAAEYHVVRRTDPGAGQHGHHDLGNHRQVDAHHVALGDTMRFQRVREALNVRQDTGVRQRPLFALFAEPVEGHPVSVTGRHVPVQAVVGGVERTVGEPGVEGRVGVVEHRLERGLPVQPVAGLLRPPGRHVGGRLVVDRGVGHLGPPDELFGRGERGDILQLIDPS